MIHAFYLPPGGSIPRAVARADIRPAETGVLWVDLEDPTDEEARILADVFQFHPLAIEDCVTETNHPKVDGYGDYIYLVVHAVQPEHERGRLKTSEVDFFLGRNYLVTYHATPVRAIEETRRRVAEIPGSMSAADLLLHSLLDRIVDSYVVKMEALDGEVTALEARLFRRHLHGRTILNEIFSLKKEVLQLKRFASPQREVLARLARAEFAVVSSAAALHFRDVFDHLYRVSEMVESFRDVVTSALETYLTVVANRTNEIMKVLTVASVILMSVSLVAGIYGMNFTELPFRDAPWGFWGSVGFMGATAAVLLLIFRKQRWL